MFYWGDGEQAKKPINLSIAASIVGLSAADDDRYPIVREGGLYRLRDAPDAGLPLPGKATAVAAGNGGFALMTDGTVFGWKNWSTKFHIPAGLRGVSAIQAVMDSGVALTDEGTAVSLTSGNLIEDLTEVVAVSICQGYYGGFLALKRDGTVTKSGLAVVELPNGLSDVVAIAAGKSHFLALIGDGTVVAWGQNDYGQTTVPTGLTNVTAIAAGYNHSLALRNDGTVVAWGSNETGSSYSSSYCGQSEVPSGLSNVTAISAGHSHSLALRSDGTVSQWGGDGAPPSWLCDVKAIAGGSASSLALRRDGSVVGWGSGY